MVNFDSRYKKLNDLGFVGRGKSKHRPRNDPKLYGGPYPFIQTGDVKHSSFYVTEYSQTYNEVGLAQSKLWQPGTLCITIAANIAETAILSFPACFPDSIIGFVADKSKADLKFVKYCLETYKLQMQSISQGTTQDNMSLEKLLSFNLYVPKLETQRKIAAVLSGYDDLIENNKRRIAILEKMAEEIYREWFVRLRFPGHETTKFEKGVPHSWGITTLSSIANIAMGQSPKSEFYNETNEGMPFNQGVGTYGNRFPKRELFCNADVRRVKRAKHGDILFSVRAPVGRLNIADCEMIIGRGLSAMSHKAGLNSYLFYMLRTAFSNEDIIGNGSIFNSVGKDELANFKLFDPGKNLASKFDELAKPIDQQIELLIRATDSLEKSRNLLLPRLISGKLSVEDLDIQFPPSMIEEEQSEPEAAYA